MAGMGYLGARAARALGSDGNGQIFGALSAMTADGLLHSNLPHNQIGGAALATYISALGIMNIIPPYVPPEIPPAVTLTDSRPWWLFPWLGQHGPGTIV